MLAVRRVIRILFNSMAVISLGMAGVVAVLWVRSYLTADAVGYATKSFAIEASFVNGRLHLWCWSTSDPTWAANAWWPGWRYVSTAPEDCLAYKLPGGTTTSSFVFAGTAYFRYVVSRGASGDVISYLHTPGWAVALLAITPSATWAYQWIRNRTVRANQRGLCVSCGYDLRASPDRCPECGTVAVATDA